MALLILGILLWSCVHLVPAVAVPQRAAWIERIGEGPYKGLFALLLVGSIVLMSLGWRSTAPIGLYAPPAWGVLATDIILFFALLLFLGSGVPTNIKRVLRHPQLTGVLVWALAHLLANGDRRSLILFGGFALWSIVEIAALNRRDGEWQKPEPIPMKEDLKPLVAAIIGYALLAWGHPYIAGVGPFGG